MSECTFSQPLLRLDSSQSDRMVGSGASVESTWLIVGTSVLVMYIASMLLAFVLSLILAGAQHVRAGCGGGYLPMYVQCVGTVEDLLREERTILVPDEHDDTGSLYLCGRFIHLPCQRGRCANESLKVFEMYLGSEHHYPEALKVCEEQGRPYVQPWSDGLRTPLLFKYGNFIGSGFYKVNDQAPTQLLEHDVVWPGCVLCNVTDS